MPTNRSCRYCIVCGICCGSRLCREHRDYIGRKCYFHPTTGKQVREISPSLRVIQPWERKKGAPGRIIKW